MFSSHLAAAPCPLKVRLKMLNLSSTLRRTCVQSSCPQGSVTVYQGVWAAQQSRVPRTASLEVAVVPTAGRLVHSLSGAAWDFCDFRYLYCSRCCWVLIMKIHGKCFLHALSSRETLCSEFTYWRCGSHSDYILLLLWLLKSRKSNPRSLLTHCKVPCFTRSFPDPQAWPTWLPYLWSPFVSFFFFFWITF